MFVVTKRAVSGLDADRGSGACEYPVKVFESEAQAKAWIEADADAFEGFLREKSDPSYRRVADFGFDMLSGYWTPETMPGKAEPLAHTIPTRRAWFCDLGEEDVPEGQEFVPFLKANARLWVDLTYSCYELDFEREMLERAAGVVPPHVADDPRW